MTQIVCGSNMLIPQRIFPGNTIVLPLDLLLRPAAYTFKHSPSFLAIMGIDAKLLSQTHQAIVNSGSLANKSRYRCIPTPRLVPSFLAYLPVLIAASSPRTSEPAPLVFTPKTPCRQDL